MTKLRGSARGTVGGILVGATLLAAGRPAMARPVVHIAAHAWRAWHARRDASVSDALISDAGLPAPYNGAIMPRATALALRALFVPSFSRQTGLACTACHYQFPQLTPFGRLFKLNGYTLTGLKTIGAQPADSTKRQTLALLPIPPVSAMVIGSVTNTRRAVTGTQNATASFPQQASVFLAGSVAPRVGIFSQITYSAASGSLGIDNTDIRFATHTTWGTRDVLYGLTLNNNPTVQDVWNTVPAWGYPFVSSAVAPAGNAATLIDGGLAQQVVGLGAYALWGGALYTELAAYRSAPQGAARPLDSSAVNTARGVIPYWRVGVQHQFPAGYLMVGTYGLSASLFPTGVTGPTNRSTDLGFDSQFERPAGTGGAVILRGTVIRESRRLGAYVAATPVAAVNLDENLNTVRVNATYMPNTVYGFTAGVFGTGGARDTLLYAPAPLTGSAGGSPNTRGYVGEVSVNPWQNVRVAGQYVGFTRFNGASRNYDGSGRSAGNNGTLFFYVWLAF